jgi:hypothetical protein
VNQQERKFHIFHTKNSESGLPKNRNMCLYIVGGASSSPSGEHSLGGKMNVVVGDAHHLSVCDFQTYSVLPSRMQTELNYQCLISIDPPFHPIPLSLLLLHP